MGRKAVEREYYRLLRKYEYQERYRVGAYKGYVRGSLLQQFSWRDDFINTVTSIEGDNYDTVKRKVAVLRDITQKGGQRMVELGTGGGRNKWVSERIIREADIAQSKVNYENYRLYGGVKTATEIYKERNIQGDSTYKSQNFESNPFAVIMPTLPSLPMARTFELKASGYEIGTKLPTYLEKLKKENPNNPEVIQYEGWLYNNINVPLTELGDIKNLKRYGKLFKGADYKVDPKERMNILKTSYIRAMFKENSIYNKELGNFDKSTMQLINRVKRKFRKLEKTDLLYLHIAYNDTFNWGYIYSDVHYIDALSQIDTVISNFNKMKKSIEKITSNDSKKKLSREQQIYLNFRKSMGDFYD